MKNLAEDSDCDEKIRKELKLARIKAVDVEQQDTEVPYSVIGELGDIEFRRAWGYWMVDCRVPLKVAEQIYADPLGEAHIRAGGHASGPRPKEWIEYVTEDGVKLLNRSELPYDGWEDDHSLPDDCRVVDNPAEAGDPVITTYHIDSLAGLRFFADMMREHDLA